MLKGRNTILRMFRDEEDCRKLLEAYNNLAQRAETDHTEMKHPQTLLKRFHENGLWSDENGSLLITDESDTIYTGRLTYAWKLSDTASFGQSLLVESGDSNTFTESVTDLRARLIGGLALVASYTVRRNSDVLPGTEKTDTRTAISLEYAF